MKPTKVVSVVLFAALALTSGVAAQQTPAEFLAVYNITVKPGHAAQFEDFLTKLKAGADKIGAAQQWGVGQVAFGGPGGGYAIGLPFEKWGEMDAWTQAPQTLIEAYGEEEGAKIYRNGTMAIQSSETSVGRHARDLSYNIDKGFVPTMFQIRVNKVHLDKQDEYRVFVQALNEAWKQAGDNRQIVRRTNVLGPTATYTSSQPFTKWADRDAQNANIWEVIEKAHGATAARRLRVLLNESIASTEVFVLAIRPDLSRMAGVGSSNQ